MQVTAGYGKACDAVDRVREELSKRPLRRSGAAVLVLKFQPFCVKTDPSENPFGKAVVLTHFQHGIHHFAAHQTVVPCTAYNLCSGKAVDHTVEGI